MPKSRVDELKSALKTKVDAMQEFSIKGIKVEDGNVEVKSADASAYQKLFAEAQEIQKYIKMEQFGVQAKSWLDGNNDGSFAMQAAAHEKGLQGINPWMEAKTLGQTFADSAEFKKYVSNGGQGTSTPFNIEAGDISKLRTFIEKKDVYGAMTPQVINQGLGTVVQFDPLVPRGHRPTRVRDLFPVAATNANLIDYFQVLGFLENQGDGGAAPVQDYNAANGSFGLKPRSNINFNPAQAPVRTIAHWEAAHRNILDDVPQLIATINNELLYGLQLQEDFQLLNGDGTVENIKGILNTENINIYTAPANELGSDTLRRAATLSMLANYPSTGYVLHPNDWEHIEIQKGSGSSGAGDGQYMLFTNIAIGAQATVWRQPVVETPAITQGTFLSGAFGTAAQVYDRQQALIRIAEQHSDLFARNAVAILCEERIALAVKRPEAFVKGTFQMP